MLDWGQVSFVLHTGRAGPRCKTTERLRCLHSFLEMFVLPSRPKHDQILRVKSTLVQGELTDMHEKARYLPHRDLGAKQR